MSAQPTSRLLAPIAMLAGLCVALGGCSLDWPPPTVTGVGGSAGAGTGGGGGTGAGGGGGMGGMLSPQCQQCSSLVLPETTGSVITIQPSENLQAAVDAAQPGDTLELVAGQVYAGPLLLPANPGAPIRIQSSDMASIAPPCTRLRASDVASLPVLLGADTGAALLVGLGSNWQIVGVHITSQGPNLSSAVVSVGGLNETDVDATPQNIVFDRIAITGGSGAGAIRGMTIHGRNITVMNSRISDLLLPDMSGDFSFALIANNTPGPLRFLNNKLESARAALGLGLAPPGISGVVPADVVFQYNHAGRPQPWNALQTPPVHLRSLVEVYNASNVTISANVFDNVPTDAAVALAPDDFSGAQSWARVDNVTIEHNTFTGVSGIANNPLGAAVLRIEQGVQTLFPTTAIAFRNNLVHSGDGRMMQVGLTGQTLIGDIEISHNTILQGFDFANINDGSFGGLFTTDNVLRLGPSGFVCGAMVYGQDCLSLRFDSWVFDYNLAEPAGQGAYPIDNNQFVAGDLGFVDEPGFNFRLTATSLGKGSASDGKDMGVDFDAFETAAMCRSDER